MRKALQLLAGTMGMLLLCLPLFSQGSAGRILGTVTDQSGGVVSGATVTVLDTDRGVTKTLVTNDAGEYNAPNLTPGNYKVRAEAKGFKTIERQNVVLEVGKEIRVDMSLVPGAVAETMTITESVPLVETTNATLGGTLDNAEITDMPLNGRNYQDLLGLRPGVVLQPGGGPWTQSTNNVRPDESVWLLDGVINANMYDTRPIANMPSPFTDGATILPIDAIQEFNTEISPKAEYGWKPGAVVNVGIKSGTNQFHGTTYGFYRSAAWDARNLFNPDLKSRPSCPDINTAPCRLSPVQVKQFGGVIGGPIKKDKLFFFAGYEGARNVIGNQIVTAGTPQTISGGGPKFSMADAIMALQNAGATQLCSTSVTSNCLSPVSLGIAGCTGTPGTVGSYACTGGLFPSNPSTTSTNFITTFPNFNISNNGIAKIDYHINNQHSINGLVMINDYNDTGIDHPMLNIVFDNPNLVRTDTVGADWVWAANSRLVNDVRFGYDKVSFNFLTNDGSRFADGTGLTGGAGYPINTGVKSVGGFPDVNLASFEKLGPWHNRPQHWGNWYYDFQDNLSFLMGKHTWKFGGEFADIDVTNAVPDTVRGRIDFSGSKGPVCPTAVAGGATDLTQFFCGVPRRGFVLAGNPSRDEKWKSYAAYLQDDYRMSPKLTLNLGLRYSYVSPMHEVNNLWGNFDPTKGLVQQGQAGVGDTIWHPDHKDFSPRIGFAYDITGKGTTVVRGGFSLIYSSFTAVEFLSQNGFQNSTAVNVAAVPTGACTVAVSPGSTCAATPGGTTLSPGGTNTFASTKVSISNAQWNSPAGSAGIFPAGVYPSCLAGSNGCNIMAVDPNLTTPYVMSWNIGVQHAFGSNLSLEVGYVGTHGSRLTGFRDINQTDANSLHAFDSTKDANGNKMDYLGYINQISNDGRSNYDSLQTTLTKRVSHGFSFMAGYTYAHGLDNGSLNRTAYIPQDSFNPQLEYGSSDFDIRHRFTFTTSYRIPGIKGFGQLLEGWKVNSIINIQTPQPWLITDNNDNFSGRTDNADRWNISGDPSVIRSGPNGLPFCSGPPDPVTNKSNCSITSGISATSTTIPDLWSKCTAVAADPATLAAGGCYVVGNTVITPNATGKFGNIGRNIFRDSGFKNVDFSVFKNFSWKERYTAEFRWEIFNLFNHPIPANPYGSANGYGVGNDPSVGAQGGGLFGCGCATADVAGGSPQLGSGAARGMQLGLKLAF